MIITQYPVDLTGRDPNNLVSNEVQLLLSAGATPYRVVVFDNGGFYSKSLKVYDKDFNLLTANVDYIATYEYKDPSDRTGMPVMGAIVILKASLTGQVRIGAQMVGGDYAFSLTAREDTIDYLEGLGSGVVPTWGGFIGVTPQWQPGELINEQWRLVTYEVVNTELEWIARAIMIGDPEAENNFRQTMRDLRDDFLSQLDNRLNDHIQNKNDPHDVTATQIGLGQVAHYPVSTQLQAETGTDNLSYLTPQRWSQEMAKLAGIPLNNHVTRTDDPHNITSAQVQTHEKQKIDQMVSEKLPINATADNTLTVLNAGGVRITYDQIYAAARTNLAAGMFTQGSALSARLGTGTTSYEHILLGDGTWVSIQSLFNQYAPTISTKFYYAGQLATKANALSSISVTYANINAYPIGTIVIYRINQTQTVGTGNGAITYNWNTTQACIRTASGWVQL